MPVNSDDTISILSHRKIVTTITRNQFLDIFYIYKDENLIERPFVHDTLENLSISINAIKKECDTLNIPWQLFLLDAPKLAATISAIKDKRSSKFNQRLISNRDGDGRGISLRIVDRVIALQEYAKESIDSANNFNGSLRGVNNADCASAIIDHFEIDPERLHGKSKESTLDYIINKLEAKNIRTARGVLSNKIMPKSSAITATYKKSSGFVVHDENVPYVFLPSEVSERNESSGRQILTLISLLVLVGKSIHNIYINGNLETQYHQSESLKNAFNIAGQILLPAQATDALQGQNIDIAKRDDLSAKYMLTPSALVVTLRNRDVIATDSEMQMLLETIPSANGSTSPIARNPKMETSVRKFCGNATATKMMSDITHGQLNSIRAQYLLFGHIDKNHYAKFKAGLGL